MCQGMGKPVFLRTGEKIVEGKKLRVPLLSEMTGIVQVSPEGQER